MGCGGQSPRILIVLALSVVCLLLKDAPMAPGRKVVHDPSSHPHVLATKFLVSRRKPNIARIRRRLETFKDLPFNHPHVGCTRPGHINASALGLQRSWKRIEISADLGYGRNAYETAKIALINWDMHKHSDWAGIYLESGNRRASGSEEVDQRSLATLAKTFLRFIWVVNPCRTVYSILDEECGGGSGDDHSNTLRMHSCVSYATLKGHLFEGEEMLRVIWEKPKNVENCDENNRSNGRVIFELLSLSQGKGLRGKIAFKLGSKMQMKFFQEQADTMVKLVQSEGSGIIKS